MKAEITKAPNLLTNGFVRTSNGDGTLIVDPNGGGGGLGPPYIEPEEPEIAMMIPGAKGDIGPQGIQGIQGIQGPHGQVVPGVDGIDGENESFILQNASPIPYSIMAARVAFRM